jgi:hypothetical protein
MLGAKAQSIDYGAVFRFIICGMSDTFGIRV